MTNIYPKNRKTFEKKTSFVFSQSEISFFSQNAPDDIFLMEKLLVLMAIYSSLRCGEITELTWKDVTEQAESLLITIQESKTKKNEEDNFLCPSSSNEKENILFYFQKYRIQFSNGTWTGRFFRKLNKKSMKREK